MAEIEQPKAEIKELVSDLMEQEPERVVIAGRKYRIGWLKRRTVRKFSHITLKEKDPWLRNVKACSCLLLNRKNGLLCWFLLRFWYPVYWRWLYYVRDIDQVEVAGVMNASKKKTQFSALSIATILATVLTDTMMTMARHEHGPAVRAGELPTP